MPRQWITGFSFSTPKRDRKIRGQSMLLLSHKDTQKTEQIKGVCPGRDQL